MFVPHRPGAAHSLRLDQFSKHGLHEFKGKFKILVSIHPQKQETTLLYFIPLYTLNSPLCRFI
jgi:hypothetical protein